MVDACKPVRSLAKIRYNGGGTKEKCRVRTLGVGEGDVFCADTINS